MSNLPDNCPVAEVYQLERQATTDLQLGVCRTVVWDDATASGDVR
jgi:hypothetical protein